MANLMTFFTTCTSLRLIIRKYNKSLGSGMHVIKFTTLDHEPLSF